jgi:hypothetical protein
MFTNLINIAELSKYFGMANCKLATAWGKSNRYNPVQAEYLIFVALYCLF